VPRKARGVVKSTEPPRAQDLGGRGARPQDPLDPPGTGSLTRDVAVETAVTRQKVGRHQEASRKATNGRGWGGSRPGSGPPGNSHALTHGAKALEALIRQGLNRSHPVGVLLAERKALYVQDLGGEAACSAMEIGLCDRLARLDLYTALVDARMIDPQTGRTRRLSWDRLHRLGLLTVRLTDSFTRTAAALGIKRREKRIELDDLRRQYGADDVP
jgi:hypothetical protein